MIGAAIIVGGWLLFSVIMAEFTYNLLTVAVSALALMAVLNLGGLGLGNRRSSCSATSWVSWASSSWSTT